MTIYLRSLTCISLVFLSFMPAPVFSNSDIETTIINGVLQAKQVLINKSSLSDIEYIVSRGISNGIKNYKIQNYNSEKIGWSVIDNSDREVFKVIFSLYGNVAKEAKYYGPLMQKNSDALELHKMQGQFFEKNFKSIGDNKYDLNDNCTGSLEFFRYSSASAGQSILTVNCY